MDDKEQRGAPLPDATPYALVGGDEGVRALVARFYDLMEMDPAYARIRALHGASLGPAREKLYLFLSGWLGGPPLYVERHGHPRLRARHLPFPIGVAERDQWLACMRRALLDSGVAEGLVAQLMKPFFETADWMRNRDG
jgi:hemoglobin